MSIHIKQLAGAALIISVGLAMAYSLPTPAKKRTAIERAPLAYHCCTEKHHEMDYARTSQG
jgi:hypothetical protein